MGAAPPCRFRRFRVCSVEALSLHPHLARVERADASREFPAARPRAAAQTADAPNEDGAAPLCTHPRYGLWRVEGGESPKPRGGGELVHDRRHLALQLDQEPAAAEREAATPRHVRAQPVQRPTPAAEPPAARQRVRGLL